MANGTTEKKSKRERFLNALKAIKKPINLAYSPFDLLYKSGRGLFIPTFLLAGVMQLFPEGVSQPAEEALEDTPDTSILAQNFNLKSIRIYNPKNLMTVFHVGGRAIPAAWNDKYAPSTAEKVSATIILPITVPVNAWSTFSSFLTSYGNDDRSEKHLEAFAIAAGDICYIFPPEKKFNIQDFIASIGHINRIWELDLKTKSDPKTLSKALQTFVLAHEMQHCEQPLTLNNIFNMGESDADLKALSVISQAGYDPDVVNEAMKIVRATRIIGSQEDSSHNTGLTHKTGYTNVVNAHINSAISGIVIAFVNNIRDDLENSGHFPEDMDQQEKNYHIAKRILNRGIFLTHPEARDFIQEYVSAFDYLNSLTKNKLFTQPDFFMKLDLEKFMQPTSYPTTPKPEHVPYQAI